MICSKSCFTKPSSLGLSISQTKKMKKKDAEKAVFGSELEGKKRLLTFILVIYWVALLLLNSCPRIRLSTSQNVLETIINTCISKSLGCIIALNRRNISITDKLYNDPFYPFSSVVYLSREWNVIEMFLLFKAILKVLYHRQLFTCLKAYSIFMFSKPAQR